MYIKVNGLAHSRFRGLHSTKNCEFWLHGQTQLSEHVQSICFVTSPNPICRT